MRRKLFLTMLMSGSRRELANIRWQMFQTNMKYLANNYHDMDEKKGGLDYDHEIMSCEFAKIRQVVFCMVNI